MGDTVNRIIGYNAKAKINDEGQYTMRVSSEEQAKRLTKTKKLDDGTKIKVERNVLLNTVKCIIQNKVITDMQDEIHSLLAD